MSVMDQFATGRTSRWCILAGTALSLAACKDSGLPGKNRPLAEAMQSEWRYPAYENTPAASKVLSLAGQSFQMTGAKEHIPERMLKSVASTDGASVYSLKSDEAPYDRLFKAEADGGYSVILPLR
jgi:hypothetical protein